MRAPKCAACNEPARGMLTTEGREPLPLCRACLSHAAEAPGISDDARRAMLRAVAETGTQ